MFFKKTRKSVQITPEQKVALWAELHCERNNVRWLDHDPMDICPMRGKCPNCQELARKAIYEKL